MTDELRRMLERVLAPFRRLGDCVDLPPPMPRPKRPMDGDERAWLLRIQKAELDCKRLTGSDVPSYISTRLVGLGEMRWYIHGHYTVTNMQAVATWKTNLVGGCVCAQPNSGPCPMHDDMELSPRWPHSPVCECGHERRYHDDHRYRCDGANCPCREFVEHKGPN